MLNSFRGSVIKVVFLFCFVSVVWAETITPVVIKEETPTYLIDIKYPQGFAEPNVNTTLKKYIAQTQKGFLNELSEDEDTPVDAPGKTSLNVTYSILYNAKSALSIRYDVSIFHKGAAHPINSVVVHNFYKGKALHLIDVFAPGVDYLKPIARFCNKAITAKKISDTKWITEGTKPTLENYSVWYFTNKGIAIIFNTYQVAAYVYGDQTVEIPFSLLASILKPELVNTVWGK